MSKSEVQVLDFDKICRLCLLEKRSMSSIFSKKKSDKKVPLPVRIMSCASLELYEGDGLPSSICNKCLLSVNQSYAFREQCEQADTTLRQYAQRLQEASEEASTCSDEALQTEHIIEEFKEERKERKEEEREESTTNNQENLRSVRKNPKINETTEDDQNELFGNDEDEDDDKPLTEIATFEEMKTDSNEEKLETEKDEKSTTKRKKRKPKEDNLNGARSLKHCDVCNQPFRYVTTLLNHKKEAHPDKTKFSCSDCGQETSTWIQYEKHLKKHKKPEESNLKTIKCDVCFKDYEYINSLLQHRRVNHPNHKIFKCTICSLQYNLYKDYTLHLRLSHRDSGIKLSLSGLICDVCGKEFLCHYNLSNHRKHHGSPQFECEVCKKLFKTKKSLMCHHRIHTGEKPYTCETCGKSFPGKSYLINHGITHSGQKPFICEVCGKAFSKKWNMIQHERIHTGERPYQCPVCCLGFIQNFILKDHMKRVHNRDLKEFTKPDVVSYES